MKPMEAYSRTMKFVWLKLLLGAAAAVGGGLIAGLFLLIGSALGESGTVILGILGVVLGLAFWISVSYYFGYMIKAGHVAVAAQGLATGVLPENQLDWAKQVVKSRFATANVYYVLDRLVSGAVSQLQKGLNLVTDLLKNVPGMGIVSLFGSQFIEAVLGKMDECCLGWCFLHPEQGSFHASCDAVSMYFQNTKALLKAGAKTSAIVMGLTVGVWLLFLIVIYGIFHAISGGFAIALLVGTALILSAKAAFLDSYIMIRMMSAFLELVPSTVLSYDLYAKLCGLSAKFRKLYDNAQQEINAGI